MHIQDDIALISIDRKYSCELNLVNGNHDTIECTEQLRSVIVFKM